MKREEMLKRIDEELKHIPRSFKGSNQNMLRASHNLIRRHDLSLNSALPAKETRIRAIETIKKYKPDFSPIYDREFFHR